MDSSEKRVSERFKDGDNGLEKTKNQIKVFKKVEEVREISANGVKRIDVETDSVDVVVRLGLDENNISAHLYSNSEFENLKVYRLDKISDESAMLTLKIGNVVQTGNFYVELQIPRQKYYCIYVNSHNGSIRVISDKYVKKLWVDSDNGSIYFRGSVKEISAGTYNGNISFTLDAKDDIEIDARTNNGLVDIELSNVSRNQIFMDTQNGRIKDRFSGNSDGYTVFGRATSYNGNVTVW